MLSLLLCDGTEITSRISFDVCMAKVELLNELVVNTMKTRELLRCGPMYG
jgi:hypothetical protein